MKTNLNILKFFGPLILISSLYAGETYAPPVLKINQEKPIVKVERATVEDTKDFGQFENKADQERELASDEETSRDPSSNVKKNSSKKFRKLDTPQKMLWKKGKN